ncbi:MULTISPECIES: hypothetical protein [Photorhabdus]|uniref:hypothetical protein n=1 Tax=Photorhabdus TaxID=29487 RepID=UPI0011C3D619|nr:hypothetical protein [Photorhabdus asymbiotica]
MTGVCESSQQSSNLKDEGYISIFHIIEFYYISCETAAVLLRYLRRVSYLKSRFLQRKQK